MSLFAGKKLRTVAVVMSVLTVVSLTFAALLGIRLYLTDKLGKPYSFRSLVGLCVLCFFLVSFFSGLFWVGVAATPTEEAPALKKSFLLKRKNTKRKSGAKKRLGSGSFYKRDRITVEPTKQEVVDGGIATVEGFSNNAMTFTANVANAASFSSLVPKAFATLHYHNEVIAPPTSVVNVRCEVLEHDESRGTISGAVHVLWRMQQLAKEDRLPKFVGVQLELGDSSRLGERSILSESTKMYVASKLVKRSFEEWKEKVKSNLDILNDKDTKTKTET